MVKILKIKTLMIALSKMFLLILFDIIIIVIIIIIVLFVINKYKKQQYYSLLNHLFLFLYLKIHKYIRSFLKQLIHSITV